MRSNHNAEYLTATQVRARYGGTSRMWLHRRIAQDAFPTPVTFGGRYRHFKLSEIEAWEADMIKRGINAASRSTSKT
jgi:predicted DNA-binding transcriptional regulator AlpA